MESEVYDKIVMADSNTLLDCLAIAASACFYEVMKKLEVDISKVHKINKTELVNALKVEIMHRIVRG